MDRIWASVKIDNPLEQEKKIHCDVLVNGASCSNNVKRLWICCATGWCM